MTRLPREQIEDLIATLEGTGCAFAVDFWLAGWSKSTHSALPSITFNVATDEEMGPYEAATVKKGKRVGQRYRVVFFEVGDDEEVLPTVHQVKQGLFVGPFNENAVALRQSGFFLRDKVVRALGTDKEFREWLRRQNCRGCGNPPPSEAAHVRSVARGAGTGHKPEYSAIPLCFACHEVVQHTQGICKLTKTGDSKAARATLAGWADEVLAEWAEERLAAELGCNLLSHATPESVQDWAASHEITTEGQP